MKRPLDAVDLAAVTTGTQPYVRFGLRHRQEVADTLQVLVDGIRDGSVCLQEASSATRASLVDFTMYDLTLTYAIIPKDSAQ